MHKLDSTKAEAIQVFDTLGVAASSLCALHCMLTPLLIGILPTVGSKFLSGPVPHHFLAFWVVLFCLTAIVPGYLRHKESSVLALMTVGLSVVLFATFFAEQTLGECWEIPLITFGNFALIAGHTINRRLACSGTHQH